MIDKIEKSIGYCFKNKSTLRLALQHKSYDNHQNNERLEFLGDSILSTVISDYLFQKFKKSDEGFLTKARSRIVNSKSLYRKSIKLKLDSYVLLGNSAKNIDEDLKHSIYEDALESIIGGIFVDSGFHAAKAFILKLFMEDLDLITKHSDLRDPKTKLQEEFKALNIESPVYKHKKNGDIGYISSLKYKGKIFKGEASSKREADAIVATKILSMLFSKKI